MNIARLQYNEKYQALEVYISGCDGACEGCHNPELWDYSIGEPWSSWGKDLRKYLSTGMVRSIWVLGGEPCLQNGATLELFLQYLSQYKKSIVLWTRFSVEDISSHILQHIDYIKVGEYQKDSEPYEEPLFGIKLASGNQRIIRI